MGGRARLLTDLRSSAAKRRASVRGARTAQAILAANVSLDLLFEVLGRESAERDGLGDDPRVDLDSSVMHGRRDSSGLGERARTCRVDAACLEPWLKEGRRREAKETIEASLYSAKA